MQVLVVYKRDGITSFYTFVASGYVLEVLESGHGKLLVENKLDLDSTIKPEDRKFFEDFMQTFNGRRVYSDEYNRDIPVEHFNPPVQRLFFIEYQTEEFFNNARNQR